LISVGQQLFAGRHHFTIVRYGQKFFSLVEKGLQPGACFLAAHQSRPLGQQGLRRLLVAPEIRGNALFVYLLDFPVDIVAVKDSP